MNDADARYARRLVVNATFYRRRAWATLRTLVTDTGRVLERLERGETGGDDLSNLGAALMRAQRYLTLAEAYKDAFDAHEDE